MHGKKVLNNLYWHIDLNTAQPEELQSRLAKADALSQLTAGVDYNIVKYDLD
jgi:hypothetical protein